MKIVLFLVKLNSELIELVELNKLLNSSLNELEKIPLRNKNDFELTE